MLWFPKNATHFLSNKEVEEVMDCVRLNEKSTSGEIRLFIESHCAYMDPMRRAQELFQQLQMFNTIHRNAVLIYIAYKDKDFALIADKAMYEKTNHEFWNLESKKLATAFHDKDYVAGIKTCITNIGTQLKAFFPHHGENKNELPDEIVFGK